MVSINFGAKFLSTEKGRNFGIKSEAKVDRKFKFDFGKIKQTWI